MKNHKNYTQLGFISTIALILTLTIVLLVGSIGFGVWAFTERSDYKNNSDRKVDAAVAIAKAEQAKDDELAFAEKEKSPYRTYTGSSEYAQPVIVYPKTWSVYDASESSGSKPVNIYFAPDIGLVLIPILLK